ncbi:hypothetical protein IQ255_29210 [Pleurocapsales cyanobacterium LEGE 10410]|nr:hypothetical protein [Pleurocapsales cyanobacterium LEGE 10410]
MQDFKGKRLVSIGLSAFALFVGSVGLTGCEVETEGEAEELGEDIDEGAEDLREDVEGGVEDLEEEVEN